MTESTPEHQDPAEQYQTGTETETSGQPDPGVDTADGELTHGGEMVATGGPIEVAPSAEDEARATQVIGGNDFTIDPENGHRRA